MNMRPTGANECESYQRVRYADASCGAGAVGVVGKARGSWGSGERVLLNDRTRLPCASPWQNKGSECHHPDRIMSYVATVPPRHEARMWTTKYNVEDAAQ